MANPFGYNQLYTMYPRTWFLDGYIQVGSDGYTVSGTLPQGFSSLKHNATGNYTLFLKECWSFMHSVTITTELSSGSSPSLLLTQVQSNNIGVSGNTDGQEGVTFELFGVNGTPTDLPAQGGFRVLMVLKV